MERTQSQTLEILTHAPTADVKQLADELLPLLGDGLTVAQNRTGLVMLPCRDTVHGTLFHLGEVLIAEAEVQRDGLTGYGAILGRDLEGALAVALLDLAWQAGIGAEALNAFLETARAAQRQSHDALFQKVEATRVQMETF